MEDVKYSGISEKDEFEYRDITKTKAILSFLVNEDSKSAVTKKSISFSNH